MNLKLSNNNSPGIVIFLLMLYWVIPGTSIAKVTPDYQITPIPDWIIFKNYKLNSTHINGQNVRYQVVDKQVKFNEKSATYYNHYIKTPINRDGVEKVSKISIRFSLEYGGLNLHKINVTRNGITQNRLKTASIKLLNQEPDLDSNIYNEFITAVIILKDI